MIINPADYKAARGLVARSLHAVVRGTIKCYFWTRQHLLRHVPVVGPVVTGITATASNTLIDSWRDSFRREPFYIPTQATRWMPDRGVTPTYKNTLQHWRQRLFDTMLVGVASFVIAGFGLAAALLYFFLDWRHERNIAIVVSAGIFALGGFLLTVRLPRVAEARPALADERRT
jgi:hypothetical protein